MKTRTTRTVLASLVIALGLPLVGCSLFHRAPKPVPVPPAPPSQVRVDTTERERAELAAAAVEAARRANATQPSSAAKVAVEGSAATAAAALPVPPAAAVEKAMAPVNAALSGDLEKATALWGQAQATISRLQAALEEAKLATERERQASAQALEEGRRKSKAALDAALQAQRDAVRNDQVAKANWAGAGCMVIFVGCAVLGGLTLIQRGAWIAGAAGLFCFGLAQVIGSWWFAPVVLGGPLLIGGAVAWLAWRHKHAVEAQGALKEVIRPLDELYDKADSQMRALLDAGLFDRLSDAMTKGQKAAVHFLRGDTSTG